MVRLLFILMINLVHAREQIEIKDVTIRLIPGAVTTTSGFLKIKNTTDRDLKLVGAKSNLSANVEIHEMKKVNGLMKMRPIKSVLIKKGQTYVMDGENHLMFIGLKKSLVIGDRYNIILEFENGLQLNTQAEVTK